MRETLEQFTNRVCQEFSKRGFALQQIWGNYKTQLEYGVGMAGSKKTGRDIHFLTVNRIVEEIGEHKPGTLKVGQLMSSSASCGVRSNGQHTAFIIPNADTDKITCQRCIKRLGWS